MTTDSQATTAPSKPSLGVRIGRIAFLVVAAVIVLAVAAAFFVTWTIQRSFPQTAGEVALEGLKAEVEVQRDERGVPDDHRRLHRRPVLRPGLRARAGSLLRDGLPPPRDQRTRRRDVRRIAGGDGCLPADSGLARRRRAGGRGDGRHDPRLLRGLRRGCERLPRLALGRGALPGIRRHRHAEPGVRSRAVGAGRFRRLAQGDGLGPPRQRRGRDRPRSPRGDPR